MAKPQVTLREILGEPLTYNQLDTNFTNLRDATISVTDSTNTAILDLNDTLTVEGTNITVSVDAGTNTLSLSGQAVDLSNYVTLDGAQTITGSKTITGTTELGPYRETVYDAGNSGTSFTPDANNGPVQTLTATNSNFTLNLPTGMAAGANLTLIITQNATGGHNISPNASYLFAGAQSDLSTLPNSIDIMTIFYDGTRYLCSLIKGYQ